MIVTSKIKLDMAQQGASERVFAVQGDSNTRAVEAELLANGSVWKPDDGWEAAITYRKPDGTKGFYNLLDDGSSAIRISGSTATVVLAAQMLTEPGTVRAAIVFNNQRLDQLTSFPFLVSVARNQFAGAQQSEDYIRLQWLEDKLEEWIDELTSTEQAVNAGQAAQEATVAAAAAQEKAAAAENAADTANAAASRADDAAAGTNTARENAETAAASANAAAASAQEMAASAENAANTATAAASRADAAAAGANTAKESADTAAASANTAAEAAQAVVDEIVPEMEQLKKELATNRESDAESIRKLDCLWKLNQGISYQFETDDTAAYCKTTPSGAKLTSVQVIGGHTEVIDGVLISSDVESITKRGKNLFDISSVSPQTISGVTFTPQEDGSIILNGNSTAVIAYMLMGQKLNLLTNGKTYSISGVPNSFSGSGDVVLNFWNKDWKGDAASDSGNGVTFTPKHQASVPHGLAIRVSAGVTLDNVTVWPMLEMSGKPTNFSKYHEAVYPVPAAVRNLPGYGLSVQDVYNSIDQTDTGWQYVQRVGIRAYQEGDTITDGVTSCFLLEMPVVSDITDLMAEFPKHFEVEAGGTITMENVAQLPTPNTEKYLIALAEVNS